MELDAIDRQLIVLTQTGLPLTERPYQLLAEQLSVTAEEVMQRFRAMQENGVIRRIGAVPNHYKLGYGFNGMTVWDVDDEMIDALGAQVAQLSFVSHCYQRPRHLPDWPYNLFAMIHAKTEQDANVQIDKVAELLDGHVRSHQVLYSSRILKKTGLRIAG